MSYLSLSVVVVSFWPDKPPSSLAPEMKKKMEKTQSD